MLPKQKNRSPFLLEFKIIINSLLSYMMKQTPQLSFTVFTIFIILVLGLYLYFKFILTFTYTRYKIN